MGHCRQKRPKRQPRRWHAGQKPWVAAVDQQVDPHRDHREAGGDAPTNIRIRTTSRDFEGRPWVQIDIEDDGPGFPADILERPFEPHVSRKPGGSGLGL